MKEILNEALEISTSTIGGFVMLFVFVAYLLLTAILAIFLLPVAIYKLIK